MEKGKNKKSNMGDDIEIPEFARCGCDCNEMIVLGMRYDINGKNLISYYMCTACKGFLKGNKTIGG